MARKWIGVAFGLVVAGCTPSGGEHATGSDTAAVCVANGAVKPCRGTCIGPQNDSRYFAETGIEVRGSFLDFMRKTGGLKATGLPISNVFDSTSRDGTTNATQCFERQVLEYRPTANGCEATVLGRQLARERYERTYGDAGAPNQSQRRLTNEGDEPVCFAETGHCIEPIMYGWWSSTGGLAVNGFPISDYFEEESPEEPGRRYWVQYFERTVGEYHETADGRWFVEGQLLGKYAPECPTVQTGTKVKLVSSRTFAAMRNRAFPAAWWTTTTVGGRETIAAFTSEAKLVVRLTRVEDGGRKGFDVFPRTRPDGRTWSAEDIAKILEVYSNDNEEVDVWRCLGAAAKVLVGGAAAVLECAEALETKDVTFCTNEIEVGVSDVAELVETCFPDRDDRVIGTPGLCAALDNGVFRKVTSSCNANACVCVSQ